MGNLSSKQETMPTAGSSQPLENIVIGLLGEDPTTIHELEEAFSNSTGAKDVEDLKELMRDILKGAVVNYQRHVFAVGKPGRALFREAEEWILQEDVDGLFSFETICEVLGMNPPYVRRGLREWKERQMNGNKPYRQAPGLKDASLVPESRKNIEYKLTRMQTKVLRGAAISACDPTIKGNKIRKQINLDSRINTRNVDYYLREAYARLNAHGMPSALYIAFRKGILTLNDIPSGNRKSIAKGLEKLTPDEEEFIKAYGKLALRDGHSGEPYMRRFLGISRGNFQNCKNSIYKKFGVENTAYLGIVLYLYEKGRSGALKRVA